MARGAARQMARIVMVEKFLWDSLLKGGVSELQAVLAAGTFCPINCFLRQTASEQNRLLRCLVFVLP